MGSIRRGRVPVILAGVTLVLLGSCGAEPDAESFTIGVVTNNANGLRNVDGFKAGMAELGYVEGQNVTYVDAGEPLKDEELASFLDELADQPVDLIFTAGTPTGVAAHEATAGTDIPVVFGVIADPLRAGVMQDLSRPGGNMTGVQLEQDQSRRLQYLVEIGVDVETILVLFNPDDAAASSAVDQVRQTVPQLGVTLELVETRTGDDVLAALAAMPESIDAIFLVPDSVVNAHLADIVAVAANSRIPTSGPSIAQVEGGALTTYGFVHHDAGAQAAQIADRVLNGAEAGSVPVENTESFLAINLEVAQRIGLVVPDDILQQADVILRPGDGG